MPPRITDPDRYLLDRFTIDDACWLWTGTTRSNGYGWVSKPVFGTSSAHRAVLQLLTGEVVDPALDVHHLCYTRNCVRPSHLAAMTHRDNVIDGNTIAAKALWTHCKHGHELTPENTILRRRSSNGALRRECRTCANARRARYGYATRRIDAT